ncbi:MAG: glycosyltransferase family 4 protein [bacterium]
MPITRQLGKTFKTQNIGFIVSRLAGTDGVTLETYKWIRAFNELNCNVFIFSGLLENPDENCMLEPKAFFGTQENMDLHKEFFHKNTRPLACSIKVEEIKNHIKSRLYLFVEKFNIDILIPENVLAIPMHIPLGLALAEVIAETNIPAIAHHHDFYWERLHFFFHSIQEYLDAAFPPSHPNIQNVVINRLAQQELAHRRSLASMVIPNVADFDTPPQAVDDYNRDLRERIGIGPEDFFILQPTRIVARKGIEHAIDLIYRLKDKRFKLVISHQAGDEGFEYMNWIKDLAADRGIYVAFLTDELSHSRCLDKEGKKRYTIWDVYANADFVTYPSLYEGFGNAFLEAIYFKRPVLINRYAVYITEIEPKGFKVISINGRVTNQTVNETRDLMNDPEKRNEITEYNYKLGMEYYSFRTLKRNLSILLSNTLGQW